MCGFALVPSLLFIWSGSALKPPIKVSLPWEKKKSQLTNHTWDGHASLYLKKVKWVLPPGLWGRLCTQSAFSSRSIYVLFRWQRGLEFDLSLSLLPLQAENLTVKLNNRLEYITSQNVLSNEVNTRLFCSSLSCQWPLLLLCLQNMTLWVCVKHPCRSCPGLFTTILPYNPVSSIVICRFGRLLGCLEVFFLFFFSYILWRHEIEEHIFSLFIPDMGK